MVSDSFVTPWTVTHQAPLSMVFPRQEYWSGLLFSSLGDVPDRSGVSYQPPALQVDFLPLINVGIVLSEISQREANTVFMCGL